MRRDTLPTPVQESYPLTVGIEAPLQAHLGNCYRVTIRTSILSRPCQVAFVVGTISFPVRARWEVDYELEVLVCTIRLRRGEEAVRREATSPADMSLRAGSVRAAYYDLQATRRRHHSGYGHVRSLAEVVINMGHRHEGVSIIEEYRCGYPVEVLGVRGIIRICSPLGIVRLGPKLRERERRLH